MSLEHRRVVCHPMEIPLGNRPDCFIARGRRFLIAIILTFMTGLSAPAQSVLWTTNYYSVTGATPAEIRRSLAQARPWRNALDAYTSWHIDSRFQVAASPEGCRCVSFTNTIRIATTAPRWLRPTNATPGTVQSWVRYSQALWKHESGHAQLALAAAAEQHQRVKRLGAEPDCHSLRNRINKVAQEVLGEYRRREQEHDKQTDHGRKEGAVLRGSGPPESPRRRSVPAPP